ncbi:MAG: hypothetical protein ACC707_15720, partial [Thiohalomonadales bacterium]
MSQLNHVATVMTGASYVAYVPNKVCFSYAGANNETVANRFVLYWVYNADGDGLNDALYSRVDSRDKGQFMPVGLGMTNESGELIPIKRVPGLSPLDSGRKEDIERQVKYRRPLYVDRQSIREQDRQDLLIDTRIPRRIKRTVTAFGRKKETGFMLLPVDNIHLTDFESLDLVELGKNSPMVWKGLIDQPNKPIEL